MSRGNLPILSKNPSFQQTSNNNVPLNRMWSNFWMHVYVYVYIYTHTFLHRVCTHTHTCASMFVRSYFSYTHVNTHTHIYIHICMDIYIYSEIYLCACVLMECSLSLYIYIHILAKLLLAERLATAGAVPREVSRHLLSHVPAELFPETIKWACYAIGHQVGIGPLPKTGCQKYPKKNSKLAQMA